MRIISKIVRKVTKISGFKIVSDMTYAGVIYGMTGNLHLSIGSLSTMKVASAVAYGLYDEVKINNTWIKALGWEAIMTTLGPIINYILTGDMSLVLTVTLAMKVMVPIYVLYEKLWRKQK